MVVSITPQQGGWVDADIAESANIAARKTIARRSLDVELFGPTTTIAALTKLLHIARAAGTIVAVEAIITVQATGADRTVTVDLQKSTGGGAFATILSTTVNIDNTTVVRTAVLAVVSNTDLVDGDILQAVVTVAGSAGNQAQGLLLTVTFDERPA
jgi:hypothetical protein